MLKISRFLAVLGFCSLFALQAGAEELKPLPELSPSFNLGTYAAQTGSIEREFDNLPHVAFKVSLPHSWIERTALGQDYGELTRFDGPAFGDVRPYFSFKRIQVNRENSARNELIAYMLKSGFVLRAFKEIDDRNVEALYVVQDANGDSFVVRAIGRIQGPALLLAEYAVPVIGWDKMRDEQTFATRSFKFTRDTDEPIEKRIERVYHKSLSFYYPASWVFEGEKAAADNQVVISLANPGIAGARNGAIRLALYSGRSLVVKDNPQAFAVDVPSLLRDIKERYRVSGYDLSASIEQRKPDLNISTKFAALEVYNLSERKTDYDTLVKQPVVKELWVAVLQTDEQQPRTMIVELETPARTQDIYAWSVNTRAFEIILKSIQ